MHEVAQLLEALIKVEVALHGIACHTRSGAEVKFVCEYRCLTRRRVRRLIRARLLRWRDWALFSRVAVVLVAELRMTVVKAVVEAVLTAVEATVLWTLLHAFICRAGQERCRAALLVAARYRLARRDTSTRDPVGLRTLHVEAGPDARVLCQWLDACYGVVWHVERVEHRYWCGNWVRKNRIRFAAVAIRVAARVSSF